MKAFIFLNAEVEAISWNFDTDSILIEERSYRAFYTNSIFELVAVLITHSKSALHALKRIAQLVTAETFLTHFILNVEVHTVNGYPSTYSLIIEVGTE